MGKVMAAVGLKEVDTYVLHLHNNMAQYITTSPILELCLAEEWRPVAHVSQWWQDQYGIDLGIGQARPADWEMEEEKEDTVEREAAERRGEMEEEEGRCG